MSFPTSISSFNDPTASDKLSSPSHSALHQSVNTDLENVETKLGTGSATPSSGAVLVGNGVGSSTWDTSPNNLALDTPTLNTPDLNGTELILDADGNTSITADTNDQIDVKINGADDFQFLANNFKALAGSKITTDRIDELSALTLYDANGNEYIAFSKTAAAINYLTYANSAIGTGPSITASGDDTNVDINIVPKGTGGLVLPNNKPYRAKQAGGTIVDVVKLGSDDVLKLGQLRYQANTTSSTVDNIVPQFGWGFIAGNGTNNAEETVTFPTAFSTVRSVHVTPLGVITGADPAAITDFGSEHANDVVMVAASDITTSGFNMRVTAENGRNLAAAATRYGYSWIAFGTKT